MINKTFIFIFLLLALCSCAATEDSGFLGNNEYPLNVAIQNGVPGYFIVGGESYGYSYDLLNAYAAYRGKGIKIHRGATKDSLIKNLTKGDTDVILSLSDNENDDRTVAVPLYATTYIALVSAKGIGNYDRNGEGFLHSVAQKSVILVSAGFEGTKSYNELLDSLPEAEIYVSSRESLELIRSLAVGESDIIICEKSEALLAQHLIKDVEIAYEFSEKVSISLVFGAAEKSLHEDFVQWLEDFRNSREFESLNNMYFKKGFARHVALQNKYSLVVGGISVWDDIIREVGKSEGIDWRLLSAIAYNESRFQPDAVSPKGARGLMQIMPVVARQFKMEGHDLHDPRISLSIACKLIKNIEKTLSIPPDADETDHLGIVLAAYNCGVGNVQTARSIAEACGENKDSWEVVSKYLVLMGDDSFLCDTITYKKFRGSRQTLAFVNNVKERYGMYRSIVS